MKKTILTLLLATSALSLVAQSQQGVNRNSNTIDHPEIDQKIGVKADIIKSNRSGQPCPGMPTVTDIDGNSYNTVLINDKCWMKENLRVVRYQNGDSIPTGLNNAAWGNATGGAYAFYMNNNLMREAYGLLYNWFAVDDERGLCPEGWHVPGFTEWNQLVSYVVSQGFSWQETGKPLKSCRQINSPLGGDCDTEELPRWKAHNVHYGTDDFGLSTLPGGSRNHIGQYPDGTYSNKGYWWTGTENCSVHGLGRSQSGNSSTLDGGYANKKNGFSVRCVREPNFEIIPEDTTVENLTVVSGQDTCFNATQSITVQNMIVESGGNVTLIAGNEIKILPETQVHNNAYFRAYIAPTGPFCNQEKSVIASQDESVADEIIFRIPEKEIFFRIYPNPTTGQFTLELNECEEFSTISIEISSMVGESIIRQELPAARQYQIDLSRYQPGIYLVRVIQGSEAGVLKVVKK